MQKTCLFLLFFLSRQSFGGWTCGGARIDYDKQCRCGSDVLTMEDDNYRRQCCGPDTCSIDDNGHATCPDGVTCNTSKGWPWNCGNIMIAQEKTCQCNIYLYHYDQYYYDNTSSLEYDQYYYDNTSSLDYDQYGIYYYTLDYHQYFSGIWCCPSGPCTYQDDGTAMCHNATIVYGRDKGCDSGVCWSRMYQSCKSGNQCVDKRYICHGGAPLCDDGSDLATCSPDNGNDDICYPHYHWSGKCSADIPTHQECYNSVSTKDNRVFDCINRGDEINNDTEQELVDYASMTSCDYHLDTRVDPGLMCGSRCRWEVGWPMVS